VTEHPAVADARAAATTLLSQLDEPGRHAAQRAFADDEARRRLEYRPRPRPGVCLDDLDRSGRKAAHQLLATALSPHAYAQAMTIMALEEVLDRQEGGGRGRHSNDFYVVVFGEPDRDERWGWRFEGHHLSVSMTVIDGGVSPTPVFLGANPAATTYAGRPVVRPLAPEEDLARALLDAMGPAARDAAIVAPQPPPDIRSSVQPRADDDIEPRGVAAGRLGTAARALLDQLVAVYLDRLPPALAEQEAAHIDRDELHFAWEGALTPGLGHYYRVQAADLLIEYDNTANDANHAHTVLRRPRADYGEDLLAAHRAEAH
jgi:hypothetical protein